MYCAVGERVVSILAKKSDGNYEGFQVQVEIKGKGS